jgi:hypothetical protein
MRSKSSTSGHHSEGGESKDTWDSSDRRSSEGEDHLSPPVPAPKRRSLRSHPHRSKEIASAVSPDQPPLQPHNHQSESSHHYHPSTTSHVSNSITGDLLTLDAQLRFAGRRSSNRTTESCTANLTNLHFNSSSSIAAMMTQTSLMQSGDDPFGLSAPVKVERSILIDRSEPKSEGNGGDILELPMMSLEQQIDLERPLSTLQDCNSSTANDSIDGHTHHNRLSSCSLTSDMRHSLGGPIEPGPISPDDVASCASTVEPIVVGLDASITSDFDLAMEATEDGLDGLDGSCTGSELLDQFHLDQISGLLCFRRSGNGSELENDTNLNNVSHLACSSGSNSNVSIGASLNSVANVSMVHGCTLPLDLDKELVNMLSTSATNSNVTFLL